MAPLVRVASRVLVGREEELAGVVEAVRRPAPGAPAMVVVRGRAGIGKTRFVTSVAERLREQRVGVLEGGCLDVSAGRVPFAPFVSALARSAPAPERVLDALRGRTPTSRSAAFELLATYVRGTAQRRPTVLVIEDVHWSDQSTRDAVRYLFAMAGEGRWSMVVTLRDEELVSRPEVTTWLGQLASRTAVSVTLDPFSPTEVARQIEGITGRTPVPGWADAVHRRSGGVPLLVEELVAAVTAGVTGVPDHLRELFLARVGGLGKATRSVVEVVAATGSGVEQRLVTQVSGLPEEDVAAGLDRATAADVLRTDGRRYWMRHDLLAEAVRGSISAARRRRLHAAIATSMQEAHPEDVTTLANHWYAAGEAEPAARYGLAAAALAERVHSPADALLHLQRVLDDADALPPENLEQVGGRVSLLSRAAEAAYLCASPQATTLAERALAEPGDAEDRALRWERLARYRFVSGDGPGTEQAYAAALEQLPHDAASDARGRVLAAYAWHLQITQRTPAALACSDRALVAARASGDRQVLCQALLAWGLARQATPEGAAALEQARDIALGLDTPDELGRAHLGLNLALGFGGKHEVRERVLQDGLRRFRAHGIDATYGMAARYMLAEVHLQSGRWDEARHELELMLAEDVQGIPALFTHAYSAWLAGTRGDATAVGEHVSQVAAMTERVPQQPVPMAVAWCGQAELLWWSRDEDGAAALAARAVHAAGDSGYGALARALLARAAADRAERHRQHGLPTSVTLDLPPAQLGRDRDPRSAAFAATLAAELARGRGERDVEPWRAAGEAWRRAADPYLEAYCDWRLATALLATRPGRGEARERARDAYTQAEALGARPLLDAVSELSQQARLGVGSDEPVTSAAQAAQRLGLTRRELEILPHLAAGRTNAQIAGTLVISPRTVGVHVSHILAKLGASRRAEVAAIARAEGLLDE